MPAMKKDKLEELEKEYGLSEDGLSYQHRCSRIAAYQQGKGELWHGPVKKEPRTINFKKHPLYGIKLMLTPLMTPDANRALAYDEDLGPEIVTADADAGETISKDQQAQRMFKDYDIVYVNEKKRITAKTTFPKIGTEITFRPGIDLCPVVRGNDGQTGYLWSFPATDYNFERDGEEYLVRIYGLKGMIRQTMPSIESSLVERLIYIDGVTAAVNIQDAHRIIQREAERERVNEKVGVFDDGGII